MEEKELDISIRMTAEEYRKLEEVLKILKTNVREVY